MTNRPRAAISATDEAVGSDIRQMHGADGALVRRNQKSVGYRQISSSAVIGRPCAQPFAATNRYEITVEYQLLIYLVESPLRTRYSGSGRCKFGRICQRFWVRSSLRWRSPSDSLSRSCHALSRDRDFSRQNEGTRCVNFSWHSPCCLVSTGAIAEQRSGTPEEQEACSRDVQTLLPPGDRSGRLHHSGLPSAKSTQDQPSLRSGAEKPRAISRARVP